MSRPAPAELTTLSIAQAGSLMTRGEITSTALTEAFLARIEAVDHKIASYITVTAERARIAAKQADMELSQGLNRGPLHHDDVDHFARGDHLVRLYQHQLPVSSSTHPVRPAR